MESLQLDDIVAFCSVESVCSSLAQNDLHTPVEETLIFALQELPNQYLPVIIIKYKSTQ